MRGLFELVYVLNMYSAWILVQIIDIDLEIGVILWWVGPRPVARGGSSAGHTPFESYNGTPLRA